jgi:hypothetical protein
MQTARAPSWRGGPAGAGRQINRRGTAPRSMRYVPRS